MTTTSKLARMPYAQAYITRTNDGIILTSYKTNVASLTKDGWLTISGLYSTTTRKHLMAFVKEFCPTVADFATVKYLATHNEALNINTGELVSLE